MTIKRSITIKVEMTSGVSEAHLTQHMDEFVRELKSRSENMRFDSWRQAINTSWDAAHPVEIRVTATVQ